MKIPNALPHNVQKVIIDVKVDNKTMSFHLNQNRKIDHKMLNLLRNEKNIERMICKGFAVCSEAFTVQSLLRKLFKPHVIQSKTENIGVLLNGF